MMTRSLCATWRSRLSIHPRSKAPDARGGSSLVGLLSLSSTCAMIAQPPAHCRRLSGRPAVAQVVVWDLKLMEISTSGPTLLRSGTETLDVMWLCQKGGHAA